MKAEGKLEGRQRFSIVEMPAFFQNLQKFVVELFFRMGFSKCPLRYLVEKWKVRRRVLGGSCLSEGLSVGIWHPTQEYSQQLNKKGSCIERSLQRHVDRVCSVSMVDGQDAAQGQGNSPS